MTLTQRRLYTYFFFLLFAITAPILIFMAKGYSFDTIGGVFVHNGAVTIKSTPKKADFYLDGKKISNRMLNVINNYYVINGIRFGEHTLECKKDGHTSWKKNIDVHSGISTEFWNILLFPLKNTTLKNYSPIDIQRFYISPRENNELVLYQKNDTEKVISIFNTETTTNNVIYSTNTYTDLIPNNAENIEWSSNHKKLLIPADKDGLKDYIITTIENNNSLDFSLLDILTTIDATLLMPENITGEDKDNSLSLAKELPVTSKPATTTPNSTVAPIKKQPIAATEESKANTNQLTALTTEIADLPEIHQARWMFDSDHQILLLTKNHRLLFIDADNPSESKLLDIDVNGFDFAGDHIYYTKLNENLVWDIKPNKPKQKKPLFTVKLDTAVDSFVKLFAYDELRIALITPEKKLYLFNNDSSNDEVLFTLIEDNVMNLQFSDDGKKMLYWTDNSIWAYMLREWDNQPRRVKGDKLLVTESLPSIKNVQWMETFENILFTTDTTVHSAELDTRDQVNNVNVLDVNSIPVDNSYIYNKDNGTLYFTNTTSENTSPSLQSVVLIEHKRFLDFGN